MGIRHHGPGSARRTLKALQTFQPDILLIEAVQELKPLLPTILRDDLQLPLAALIYNPKSLQQALYYPFAAFSPEWQALRYALQQGIPIEPIDLPQTHRLALPDTAPPPDLFSLMIEPETADKTANWAEVRRDPIGYLAQLSGYQDSERWWEVHFEHDEDLALFEHLNQLISELRQALDEEQPQDALEELREAYMRKSIRDALKKGHQRIAVLCGAWHIPAIQKYEKTKSADQALLKGLPKIKLQATWIPWSYERLALSSGYGAGVQAPLWYELLFEHPKTASLRWLTRAAALFRQEDLVVGAASTVEAVRLAEQLAALRQLTLPGMQELEEAALTVLAQGQREYLSLLREQLLIGQKLGELPKDLSDLPLQTDFEEQLQQLRLSQYKTQKAYLKATSTRPKGGLDLREAFDRKQSQFLHQLLLIDLPWAKLEEATGRELSTKNEYWYLEWKPEYVLLLIEAATWGNTVEQAAQVRSLQKALQSDKLLTLSRLLEQCLKAQLIEVLPPILQKVQHLAALSTDVWALLETLPQMVQIIKYGDVRQTDGQAVEQVLLEMLPRICIGLPQTLQQLAEDQIQQAQQLLIQNQRALKILSKPDLMGIWEETLIHLLSFPQLPASLQGFLLRLLLDQQLLDLQRVEREMSLALSLANKPMFSANWLEGFLNGSALLLLHHPFVLELLDTWLGQVPQDHFLEILPLLRRTFANFSKAERSKLLERIQQGLSKGKTAENNPYHPERTALVLPLLQQLLGV
jgi:hypothetical protein